MKNIKLFDYQQELFDYQKEMVERIGRAFGKHQSVMVQMPTGTGKTIVLSNVVFSFLERDKRDVWAVAHRRELVSQIRETLKRVFSNHPVPLSKEGSTAFPKPLSPQGTGDVTAPARRSDIKVGGASKPSPLLFDATELRLFVRCKPLC